MVGFLSEEIDKQERLSDADKFSQFWLLVPEYWVATFYQQSASLKSHPALQTCGSVITLITIHNTCQRVGIIIHRNYLLNNHLSHGELGGSYKGSASGASIFKMAFARLVGLLAPSGALVLIIV